MSYSIESLGLRTLQIDENNPRFPPTKSQEEAIAQMLDYIPDKILAIARDISKNDLNPLVTPGVLTTEDGRNIVKDGNRRITAIKLMMDPSLIKGNDELKRKFAKIGAGIDRSKYKYITCAVFDDVLEIDHWVELNHQNNTSGIGHEDWGAIPKMRDSRNRGKTVPVLELYEIAKKNSVVVNEDSFPISTFERLVKSKGFRDLTGWKMEGDHLSISITEDEFVKGLVEVLKDLTDKKSPDYIDSRAINDVKGISNYIESKKEEGFFKGSGEGGHIQIESVAANPPKGVKKKRTRSGVITLIAKDTPWTIDNPRIRDLFDELRSMSVEAHPNAVSVLFRAFVEISTKYYADCNNISDIHLGGRINKISEYLYKKGKISEDVKRAVKSTVSKSDGVTNLNEDLNQYGHNYTLNPTPHALSLVFNSIKPLFDAMFGENKP